MHRSCRNKVPFYGGDFGVVGSPGGNPARILKDSYALGLWPTFMRKAGKLCHLDLMQLTF